MTRALLGATILVAAGALAFLLAHRHHDQAAAVDSPARAFPARASRSWDRFVAAEDPTTTSTSSTSTTAPQPHPAPTTPPGARNAILDGGGARQAPGGHLLSVTAYCQAGRTASGEQTRPGIAAGNRWPFGTVLNVAGYGQVTVEDRIGWGSDLDIYMPSCAQAIAWGRRTLEVTS